MATLVVPSRLLKAFVDEGLVPPDCSSLEIGLHAGKAMELTYRVMIRQPHLAPLARAFTKIDEQMKQEQAAMSNGNGNGHKP